MLVLVIRIGSFGSVVLKAGLSIALSLHSGVRSWGFSGVFVKALGGCGGIMVVVISVVVIVDVVREVGVLAGLWVGRPVVWGLMLLLTGAGHVYVLRVWWASMLVVMVVVVLSSLLHWEWKWAGRTSILHIVPMLFFSASRLYCGGGGASERLVVLLFVGVGSMVGNGWFIISHHH